MADPPAPTPVPQPTPAPEPTPPTPPPTPPAEPPRSFSQDDVNSLLARQKRELLAEAGDLAELRRKAKSFDDLEEAQKSELEKLTGQLTAAQKQLVDMQESSKQTTLRAAILAEAAKADRHVIDPEATVALIDRSTLDIGDDGTPANIAKAMDELLAKRPYLVDAGGPRAGTGADQGARTGGKSQVSEAALEGMTPEEIVQAQKDGRLESLGVGR